MAENSAPPDNESRKALELLIDAVAKEIRPGMLELRLAASTLRDLLEEPSPEAWARAIHAFNAIDGNMRGKIGHSAESFAVRYHAAKDGEPQRVDGAGPCRPAKPQPSGLLQALNLGLSRASTPAGGAPKARR